MRKFYLYLPSEQDQDVQCERWKHLFKQIDREHCEVRVYTSGLDFQKSQAKHPLPYAVEIKPNKTEGKKKSFESMWKMIMINTGKTDEDYIPQND